MSFGFWHQYTGSLSLGFCVGFGVSDSVDQACSGISCFEVNGLMFWVLCGGVNCPSGGGRRLRPSGSAVVTVCNNYVCVC